MKFPENKKVIGAGLITFALVGILVGVLLLVIPTDALLKVLFVLIGALTVIFRLPVCIISLGAIGTRAGQTAFVSSLLSVILGVLMIFHHSTLLIWILGIYLIILPILQILFAKDHEAQLKTELPGIILGIVLLILGPAATLDFLFDVAGWVIIALTLVYVVISLVTSLRRRPNVEATGARIFADTDGDGKIDTVFVDTTGDGKADTATRYDENK